MSSIDFVRRVDGIVSEAHNNSRKAMERVHLLKNFSNIEEENEYDRALSEYHRLEKVHNFLFNYYMSVLARKLERTKLNID